MEQSGKKANPFRFAERCLYDYKKNRARLDVLRGDLRLLKAASSVKIQDYNFNGVVPSVGEHSDPVAARLVRIEQLEAETAWLERQTQPITRFMEDIKRSRPVEGSLKADFLVLLHKLYFEEQTPDAVSKLLKVGKTMFYKRKQELVKNVCQYLGL